MQLEACMQLSRVTGLTLRCNGDVRRGVRRGTLLAVLPRLTPLRSLAVNYCYTMNSGECPPCPAAQ